MICTDNIYLEDLFQLVFILNVHNQKDDIFKMSVLFVLHNYFNLFSVFS